MNGGIRCLAVLVTFATGVAVVQAADTIPHGYRRVAAAHGIPAALFYAVALAESGKHITDLRAVRPWPWTLNVQGDGRDYPSRQAAVAAGRRALASGSRSIDIGLMQINWRYHARTLRSLEAGLDPYRNLDLAAGILAACYRERGEWWSAVGCYHAPSEPQRATRYQMRVKRIWSDLGETG